MDMGRCKAYGLVVERPLPEIGSTGYLLRHKRTGARVCLIANEDENKVFCVGFRTPPQDSTGVAHIVEHTALCGSRSFPVKDPFAELAKGSLNTFLNAITYPDRTIYPVASVNGKDFQNLMHVYLDAVFYPNIDLHQEIFQQEGWHYELRRLEDPITINGVVYNEMKGDYSSPECVLDDVIRKALYPDTAYRFDSGGCPDEIPRLTYQAYLDFHRNYYHPSNAFLYLYGNMDMEEKLSWIDREYLGKFQRREIDSAIRIQKPFEAVREAHGSYSIASGESPEGQTYLSMGYAVGTALEEKLYVAMEALRYALIDMPGSPVRQALLSAGIGKDIECSYSKEMLQPVFSITARNCSPDQKEAFVKALRQAFQEQADGGLNRRSVHAALNRMEFEFREADYGQFPKGLMYALECLNSWTYDDSQPFLHLNALSVIEWLRSQVEHGYFEGLIREHFLSNGHGAVAVLEPEAGRSARQQRQLEQRLEAYKASLSREQLEKLISDTERLERFQEEVAPWERPETIPMLSRADLRREPSPLYSQEREIAGCPALLHSVDSNGIVYLSLLFDASEVEPEDIPYLGVLKAVLGYVDTKAHRYQELADEIYFHAGGLESSLDVYCHVREGHERPVFAISARMLKEKAAKVIGLIREILTGTRFSDSRRIYEILAQQKARLKVSLSASGDVISATRAMSYFSRAEKYVDMTRGIAFYQAVCRIEGQYGQEKERLARKLSSLMGQVFRRENLLISIGGREEEYEAAASELPGLIGRLPGDAEGSCHSVIERGGRQRPFRAESAAERKKSGEGRKKRRFDTLECSIGNEGFLDASLVQHVSRAGNFRRAGHAYTGALEILQVILEYEYLWENVRVKGGAYGCQAEFSRNGDSCFSSFRDPNLEKTNQIYQECAAYVREFDVDDRDMDRYVIGAIREMDAPLTPAGQARRSLSAWLTGLTYGDLMREREQVLCAAQADIRSLSALVEAALEGQALCVIGNEDRIREQAHLFQTIKNY